MKLSSTSFQRFRVTFLTLAVLGLTFLVYLFIFVEGKKNYLHERAFRVLAQNEENLNLKLETVRSNARREITWRRTINTKDPGYRNLFLNLNDPSFPVAGKFNRRLTFTGIEPYREGKLDSTEQKQASSNKDSQAADNAFIHTDIKKRQGEWRVYFEDTVDVEGVASHGTQRTEKLRIRYDISLKDFLETGLIGKQEVFDEYLLLSQSAVVYESASTGLRTTAADSLFGGKSAVQTGTVRRMELAGVPYELFVQKINLGDIPDLVVGGLIREGNYRSQIYSVPLLTILFSILLMLLLALGYPFFKLMIMSSGERLQSSDAFFSVFSIMAGAFVVAIVLLSGYVYRVPDWERHNANLTSLADTIRHSFLAELNGAYAQLAQYKWTTLNKPGWFTQTGKGTYENILCEDPACHATLGADTAGSFVRAQVYPRIYPFFNNVFWIDENGLTQQTWIIDSVNTPSVEVKDRQYFRKIIESDTWNLNLDPTKPSQSFVLEPIFNRINSQNTVIMSIPFDPAKKASDPSYRPVMALEMRLHSVLDPVLPLGYGFSIIDKDGLVWFHSDEKKNLQEKFLKECGNDKTLLAMLEGNNSGHLNLTYNGNSYRAYVTPFRQLPLSLIVFYNDGYYKSISSMAISTAAIDYVLAFLPLLVLLLVHKLTFQSDLRLQGENYSFSWLSPRVRYQHHYPKLMLINGLLVLVDVVVLWKYNSEFGVWMIFTLTITLSFTATRLMLYRDRRLTFFRKYAYWFVVALFIGLAFLFADNYHDTQLRYSTVALLTAYFRFQQHLHRYQHILIIVYYQYSSVFGCHWG